MSCLYPECHCLLRCVALVLLIGLFGSSTMLMTCSDLFTENEPLMVSSRMYSTLKMSLGFVGGAVLIITIAGMIQLLLPRPILQSLLCLSKFLTFLALLALLLFSVVLLWSDAPKNILKEAARQSLSDYAENIIVQQRWNILQELNKCCGVDSYNDWNELKLPYHPLRYCLKRNDTKSAGGIHVAMPSVCSSDICHSEGCWRVLRTQFVAHIRATLIPLCSLTLIMLPAAIVALVQRRQFG